MAFVEVEAWRFEEADLGAGVSLYILWVVEKARVEGVGHTIMHTNLRGLRARLTFPTSGNRLKRSCSVNLPWRLLEAPAAEGYHAVGTAGS